MTILAANGLGTPRLLLLSATTGHPDGLANSSGLVGKRLMMHPFAVVTGLFDDDLHSLAGAVGPALAQPRVLRDRPRPRLRPRGQMGLQPTGGPFSTTTGWPWGDNPIWGPGFHYVRKRFGRSAMWGIIAEDLPEEDNQVVLDLSLTDADGIPAPRIRYRMSENSVRLLDFHVTRRPSRCARPAPTRPWWRRRSGRPAGTCSAPA